MYDASFKIAIFGDSGCGKDTLVQRFLTNRLVSEKSLPLKGF